MSTQERNITDKSKLIILIGISILLFIIASLLITPIENLFNPTISLAVFTLIMSFAISLLVYANEQRPKRRSLFGKGRNDIISVKKRVALIFGAIIFIASLLFFYIGFRFRMWYIAWISFLIGGLIIESIKVKSK